MRQIITWTVKNVRRCFVAIIGFTVLIIGIIMIVTPGPAIIVIPIGLGILATEFIWAKTLLHRVKKHVSEKLNKTGTNDKY